LHILQCRIQTVHILEVRNQTVLRLQGRIETILIVESGIDGILILESGLNGLHSLCQQGAGNYLGFVKTISYETNLPVLEFIVDIILLHIAFLSPLSFQVEVELVTHGEAILTMNTQRVEHSLIVTGNRARTH
jgi:hypothetical protein